MKIDFCDLNWVPRTRYISKLKHFLVHLNIEKAFLYQALIICPHLPTCRADGFGWLKMRTEARICARDGHTVLVSTRSNTLLRHRTAADAEHLSCANVFAQSSQTSQQLTHHYICEYTDAKWCDAAGHLSSAGWRRSGRMGAAGGHLYSYIICWCLIENNNEKCTISYLHRCQAVFIVLSVNIPLSIISRCGSSNHSL